MITIKEIANVTMTEEKKKSAKNDFFAYYVGRPISYLLTIPFLYTRISPNTITFISIIFVVLGFAFSLIKNPIFVLISWVSFFMWNLFDGIDGNIARYKKNYSKNGSLFDATSGYLSMFFTFLSIGVIAYNFPGWISEKLNIDPVLYVVAGSISGFAIILPRLLMHKKKSSSVGLDKTKELQDKSSYNWKKILVLNLTSIAGFIQVFILLLSIVFVFFGLSLFDIFTIGYLILNLLFMIITTYKLIKE